LDILNFQKKPAAKVTKTSDKKTTSSSVPEQDKEDIELNECLKKINNFKCTIAGCVKTFNSRTALGYHLKTHAMERRFVCDQVKIQLLFAMNAMILIAVIFLFLSSVEKSSSQMELSKFISDCILMTGEN
jgi:hypothetical protein